MATHGYCDYGCCHYGDDDPDWGHQDDDDDRHHRAHNCHPYCPTRHGACCGPVSPPPPATPPLPLPPIPGGPTSAYPGALTLVPLVETAYILPSLGAQALDYTRIKLAWQNLGDNTMLGVTDFRILTNTWGFPVDETDGTVVYEVTGTPAVPGVQFIDTTGTPGAVQYYGFYVNNGSSWLRAGFTACLLPAYHGYGDTLMNDLPPYLQNQDQDLTSQDVSIAAPPVPTSGGSVTSPYNYYVDVWLSEAANVMVNGTPLGMVTRFPVPPNATITITYSGSMFWQWISRAVQPQNTALTDFLNVLGFGLDTIKTQYDFKFNSLNDPMKMSLGDLASLCVQIGLPYNAELPAYAMRKAALNWGRVMQERGTLSGIAQNITLLTEYPADIQTSRNFMLDNDQSEPHTPRFPDWSANTGYLVGNLVQYPVAQAWSVVSDYPIGAVVKYNGLLYTATAVSTGIVPTNGSFWSNSTQGPFDYVCIANAPIGTAPVGSLSTYWALLYGGIYNTSHALNTNVNISGLSGNAGTWEYLESNGVQLGLNIGNGFPTPQTWLQGSSTPVVGPNSSGNTFRLVNNTGGTLTNTWIRSICRTPADITATKIVPDPQIVVEHAVPVPYSLGLWQATNTYQTNDVVYNNNINYVALRQSKGATPPSPGVTLNQNYDFETGLTPWVVGTNCTIAQSSAHAYKGVYSMAITTTATGGYAVSENVPVIPGATYQATALVFATSSVAGVQLCGNWDDWTLTYISGMYPTPVTVPANTWTEVSVVFTVPDNAYSVFLTPTIATSGTTTYWDVVELTCIATPEWGPLGLDSRFPITMSAYLSADLGTTPTVAAAVTPFVEWYDSWGNLISRVFARTSSTSGGYPTNYQFDSFATGAGMPIAGRVPVNPSAVWSVPVGAWNISPSGAAFAGVTDFDAIGAIASPAAGIAAVTVDVPAQAGDDCGVMFWYNNTSNFWMAGLDNLYYVSSGTTHTPIAYAHAPAQWDRIYVQFNNTTSTTTLPGGSTVVGPSAVVYKNAMTASNILVVVGSGGTATQTSMGSLTSPYLPTTGATTSFAGIASITI